MKSKYNFLNYNFYFKYRNFIQEEKETIQKNIKNFINFKESYLKQKIPHQAKYHNNRYFVY